MKEKKGGDTLINRLNLQQPNEVELILMKNIREELAVIPIEYISSITYDLTTYPQLSFEIPDKVTRGGQTVDYLLFHQIKGKQQLVLTINGQKSKFVIDDTITEVETATGRVKKCTAYGYERTLEKKTFLTGTSMTRQLYRPASETVEIGEGILNLFEQQTNWKIGHVDEMARKEPHQYPETFNEVLHTNFEKTAIKQGKFFWGRTLKRQIKKGENFTIKINNLTAKKENLYRDKQSFSHPFTAVKDIKSITTAYSSDSTYRFGLTYTFNYTDETSATFKAPFTNVAGFDVKIENIECAIETGEFVEKLVTRYRTFEQMSTHWYPFLMSEVAEAFECVFVFDSYRQVVDCYHKDNFGSDHGLYMSFENGIKEINKSRKIGEIVTRLYVESPNVMISEQNPLGTEYVECFDFYKREGLMSDELVKALDRYDTFVEEKHNEWLKLKLSKSKTDQKLADKQTELKKAQERYKVENNILATYIKEKENIDKTTQSEQSKLVNQINREVQTLLKEINGKGGLNEQVKTLQEKMVQLGQSIQKDQATDQQGKIFTTLDLEELEEYIVESSISNDYYLTSYALYQHALTKIKDTNDVQIDFSLTVDNLFKLLIHPDGWQAVFGLGERIYLDDTEIADDRGFIQLTGFVFNPNKKELTQLKFTNNKQPVSDLKTIGDIARKTAQTSNLTDYWKDVWKELQTNNVHVSKLVEEGLDAAAMQVRARSTINQIDITEAGIFVSDAEAPEKAIALMSGLIAFTEDNWETSKLALSSNGISAEVIAGQLLLGDKLIIGNEDNTFVINPNGLSIFDEGNTEQERIFLGLETVNGVKKARLRLHSAKDDKKLVLSEDGIYQIIPISAMDNLDRDNPLECAFYISDNIQAIHDFNLRIKLSKFRGYTKGASTTASSTTVQTTREGGGRSIVKTSNTGGAINYKGYTETYAGWNGFVMTSEPYLYPNDFSKHAHRVTFGNYDGSTSNFLEHRHDVIVKVKDHTHELAFELPTHNHELELIDKGHTHALNYGIYEYSSNPVVDIYLDGTLIASNVSTDKTYNLTTKVNLLKKGWHTIRVVGVSKTNNPLGLGRCSVDAYLGAFVTF